MKRDFWVDAAFFAVIVAAVVVALLLTFSAPA